MKAFDYTSLIDALDNSVKQNLTDGLLLSGGLDTSILTYLAARYIKPVCITVALQGSPAPDVEYATLVAHDLGLTHYIHYFNITEVDNAIKATIRILKCYDPMEIRNSAAIYIASMLAKQTGLYSIMTGDGGDELFGGYSFLFHLNREQRDAELYKMWSYMSFSSVTIAEHLGLTVKLPILDQRFKNFAMNIDSQWKVRKEKGQVWGKWILRRAFQDIVPEKILWRVKQPIEIGSGTTMLSPYFASLIPDLDFNRKKQMYRDEDKVVIRDKEHLYYYEIYRELYGIPHNIGIADKSCPDCGAGVTEDTTFCRLCGAYPI